jgi:hypothetical protein
VVAARQVPVPLQWEMGVNVVPEHDCVPHDTDVAACWQAPAPLQAPVLPQGGFAGQRLSGSLLPSGTFAQLPAAAPTLQAWQSPHALVLQQTPLTQLLPVRHSLVAMQGWPSRFRLPQWLVFGSQMLGGRQSRSPVHASRHAVAPSHT